MFRFSLFNAARLDKYILIFLLDEVERDLSGSPGTRDKEAYNLITCSFYQSNKLSLANERTILENETSNGYIVHVRSNKYNQCFPDPFGRYVFKLHHDRDVCWNLDNDCAH